MALLSRRTKETPRSHLQKLSSPEREFDLSFGGKKQSKLENMLDKLRKRKVPTMSFVRQNNH